jgi:ABC-type polysaccharide/polyol phosphate transport system ATPase subunit
MTPVIELNNVSKCYQLGRAQGSLRDAIADGARRLVSRKAREDKLFWALRNVSYEVAQGETLGIIGHNGAGKSTMLKLLSRVTFPTSGKIRTRGRMAALIELGAGFHPDLSGRENIYLNGSILGLKRREIDSQLDSIVSFAGLEKFIDTPVKRYSSGMYVRLAFAVAAHVKADLLLVDEVLSVGDAAFQAKSLTKMKELRDNGATVVFISHSMSSVRSFCSRVLLMDHGQLAMSGKPDEVIKPYEKLVMGAWRKQARETQSDSSTLQNAELPSVTSEPRFVTSELLDDSGAPIQAISFGEPLRVRFTFATPDQIVRPKYRVRVRRATDGMILFTRSQSDENTSVLRGEGQFEIIFHDHWLVPGSYHIEPMLYSDDGGNIVTVGAPTLFSVVGWEEGDEGLTKPEAEWSIRTS